MPRRILYLILVAILPITVSCGDAVSPVNAQTAELAQIQGQLETVLERLNEIEAAQAEQFGQVDDELGTIRSTVNDLSVSVGASAGASAAIEGSVCYKTGIAADAGFETSFDLRGQADGMLGVDAYGNGANATLRAKVEQKLPIGVKGGGGLEMQLCGKLTGQTGVEGGLSIDATDPLVSALQDLTSSVGTAQLANAASTVDLNGSRASQGLNALTSLSPSGISSSLTGGGTSALASALPLPPDMRTRIEDPRSILTEAGTIAESSVDLLCDPSLQVGEFTTLLSSGCDLRDQVPAPADVIDIITGLDGIQLTLDSFDSSLTTVQSSLASVQSGLSSVCNTVGNVTGQRLNIPSRSITILGNSYTTFPGYSADLFPALGAPNC